MHLFADFITLYIWSTKKSDLLSGQNNGFTDIFIIFGIVLCRIAIPPAINSARCRSMIYFLSPARHTLLSHVASGENVGRKPLPSATQRDVTPVLSDDAALWFCLRDKRGSYALSGVFRSSFCRILRVFGTLIQYFACSTVYK